MLAFVNFYLIPGVIVGSIYALGAVGVSLIFAILRFAHFAHGDLMTLGAYLALSLVAAAGLATHPTSSRGSSANSTRRMARLQVASP